MAGRVTGRGRPSTIDQLPEDLRVVVAGKLREKRQTQIEILAWVNAELARRNLEPVSRSALNRYAVNVAEKSTLLNEAREAADAIVGGLDESPSSDLGRTIIEIVRSLTFDVVAKMDLEAEDMQGRLDMLKDVSLLVERVEKAGKFSAERELKVRETVMAEQRKKLDQAVTSGGLDPAAVDKARQILGL